MDVIKSDILKKNEEYLKDILQKQYSQEEIARIYSGYNSERYVTLRINTLKTSKEKIVNRLEREGISFEGVPWSKVALIIKNRTEKDLQQLEMYENGEIYLQSLSSMLPPIVMKPQPNEDILDMAAAPGGKLRAPRLHRPPPEAGHRAHPRREHPGGHRTHRGGGDRQLVVRDHVQSPHRAREAGPPAEHDELGLHQGGRDHQSAPGGARASPSPWNGPMNTWTGRSGRCPGMCRCSSGAEVFHFSFCPDCVIMLKTANGGKSL